MSAMPNGKCRLHGGLSLSGIASPSLKSGRYSKNLPTRLMEKYDAARKDGDLLALRDDLALLDARLEDVLAKVDTGESGETWKALLSAVHEFDSAERALESCDSEVKRANWKHDREEAMRTIIVLCQAGMSDYAAWSEVKSLLESRRKISETEQKRLVAMQQMITNDQLAVLQANILASIKRHVTDPIALRGLAAEFSRFVLAGDGASA